MLGFLAINAVNGQPSGFNGLATVRILCQCISFGEKRCRSDIRDQVRWRLERRENYLSPVPRKWHNPPCNEGPSHATVASANRFSRVAEG